MTPTTSPLHGHRVLVARTREQAGELSARVRELGGEPVEAPVLALEPGDRDALDAAALEVVEGRYTLLALTSANGVDALADALARVSERGRAESDGESEGGRPASTDPAPGVQASVFDRVQTVACVGTGTAARFEQRFGRGPDLVPPTATTRALGEAVPAGSGAALLPRADIASPELPRLLSDKGYDTVEVVAYRIARPGALPPGVADDVRGGRIDLVPLTSPSMARNLVTLIGAPEIGGRVVSIGPVTSAACAALGIEVAAEAVPHDLDGLLAALVDVVGG